MTYDPHSLIEGAITSYAIRSTGLHLRPRRGGARRPAAAQRGSRGILQGYLGPDILGSGFDLDLVVHSGAGAYICGRRPPCSTRSRASAASPGCAAVPGRRRLYASPTVVNTSAPSPTIPYIVPGGADWWKSIGRRNRPTPMIYSLSGRIANPGQYECGLGITLRELIELAGGMQPGHNLKFWTPGGFDPAADRRAHRHPDGLRGCRGGRLDPRHHGHADLQRPGLPGVRDLAVAGVLPPRVVRQVHPVPRGQLLDGPHVPADPLRQGTYSGPRHPAGHRDNIFGRRSAASATARPPRSFSTLKSSARTTWTTSRAGLPRGCPPRPWLEHTDGSKWSTLGGTEGCASPAVAIEGGSSD